MAINFTYSFSPATTIVSSEVNTNFTDLRSAIRGAHHQDSDGTKIVNADISSSAAIAYSKLNLANSIDAGDLDVTSVATKFLRSDASDTFTGNLDITGYSYSVRNRVTGAGGAGYMEYREQSTGPSTPPTDYVKVWFDGAGNIWFTKDDGTNARINLSTGVITGYS